MNQTFLNLAIFAASLGSFADASSDAHAKANTYVANCRFEQPLDTYSFCNLNTYAGANAYQCALEEAMAKCKISYNADCIIIGANFTNIISHEFVGYKACEAKVYIHGYQLN